MVQDADVAMVGDARLALEALADALGSAPRGARGSGAAALVATAKQEKYAAFVALAGGPRAGQRVDRMI